jgi:hypothetical protein
MKPLRWIKFLIVIFLSACGSGGEGIPPIFAAHIPPLPTAQARSSPAPDADAAITKFLKRCNR